ncbi:MAG: TIGR02147 family protein [Bdellovibrionales bacterium]
MIYEHQNYREYLKSSLADKARAKGTYSLRAFSQRVGISNSFLSEVLSGKKTISMELAFKIAVKLNLTDTETNYFCLLVQLDQEQDPAFREELQKRLICLNPSRKTHDLSVDLFKIIANWHHFAILELTYLPNFKLDAGIIAKKLGVSKTEIELAIERLKRLELLEQDSKGLWRKAHSNLMAQSTVSHGALKLHHKEILEKAIQSLTGQSPNERMSATDILPMDSTLLPEVDRLSLEFSNAVMRLSEKSKFKDSVYALTVHFFNLTSQERK